MMENDQQLHHAKQFVRKFRQDKKLAACSSQTASFLFVHLTLYAAVIIALTNYKFPYYLSLANNIAPSTGVAAGGT